MPRWRRRGMQGPSPAAPHRFAGVLEAPLASGPACVGERLQVRGWALCAQRVTRVEARCGSAPAVALRHALPRPDVAEAYAQGTGSDIADAADAVDAAGFAGFAGDVRLDGLAPGVHSLTVTVQAGGVDVHCWRRLVQVAEPTQAYGRWRLRLLEAARARWPADEALPPGAAFATWVVVTRPHTTAADVSRTFASLRLAGGGFAAMACAAGAEVPLPPTPFIGELQAGDVLAAGAASIVAAVLREHPGVDLLYTDHDHLGADGRCTEPVLKPAWSSLLAAHPDVAGGPWLLHRSRHPDAAWVAGEPLAARSGGCAGVAHLPLPLVAAASAPEAVADGAPPAAAAAPSGTVSVIVPTCLADAPMLARCLDGLRHRTRHAGRIELVVVLNNLAGMDAAQAEAFLSPWSPTLVRHDGPFNWSALNNRGVRASAGEWLLFLNDDVEPVDAGWLDAMLALAQRPAIGAVGAVLRYPDGGLQHAGVMVAGRDAPTCRHTFRGCRGDEARVARWLRHDRVQTAVTGACLLTSRPLFDTLGGFDERLPVVFNDVDYCLRLRQSGRASAVCAAARLVHHEGRSRAGIDEGADHAFFRARWAARLPDTDAHGHPALARDRDDWLPDADTLPEFMPRISMHADPGPNLHDTDSHWRRWGEEDPYYGVITQDMFRRDKLDDQALQLFFESGRTHARHVMTMCRRHFDPGFAPHRVLDFGCGVGRLLVGFSEWATEVVGVDISDGMLAEARKNCDARGLRNVGLARSDDALSQVDGQFDLVHSTIVLQHLEPQRGRDIFARLVARVRPGGLGSLHLTYAKAYLPDTWGQPPAAAAIPAPAPPPASDPPPPEAQ
ncbi:MAG: methyltransferase domain-containing protein, partial [Burkholderiaceae bacterium]